VRKGALRTDVNSCFYFGAVFDGFAQRTVGGKSVLHAPYFFLHPLRNLPALD
jgi:hypothetical protein